MTSPHLASLLILTTPAPPVDAARQVLSAHSERMFFWLVTSSIVTGIGVIFEAPGEVRELKRWWKFKRLGKKVGYWIPVTFIGLVLVIGGIIGEGVFEFLSADAETAIRAHDENVLGNTIIQAGTAKDSADAAVKAAGLASAASSDAIGKASTANEVSGNAVTLATGARKEADSLTQEVTAANQHAADAVSRLADAEQRLTVATEGEAIAEARLSAIKTPRSLLRTKELVDALKPFSGTVFTLNAFMDDESNKFSVIVAAALKDAGWIRQQPAGINLGIPTMQTVFEAGGKRENVPSCLDTGVAVHITEKESQAELNSKPIASLSLKLRAALALYHVIGPSISPPEEHNVAVGLLDPDPGDESLRICIGKKP